MIVKRIWRKVSYGVTEEAWEGWFLFGIIPLYIRQTYTRHGA